MRIKTAAATALLCVGLVLGSSGVAAAAPADNGDLVTNDVVGGLVGAGVGLMAPILSLVSP